MEKIKAVVCPKKEKEKTEVYIRPDKPTERRVAVRSSPPRSVARSRIKLNLEPPPALPVVERVRREVPELPRMSIKFSTCTALYQPAQPIYENIKKSKDNRDRRSVLW